MWFFIIVQESWKFLMIHKFVIQRLLQLANVEDHGRPDYIFFEVFEG